ncbi:hypothetical protein [Paractinoplanes durhamensis]|uniref:hypothetical protein n=1 Tax=Paractinoplanes durhamensis TaxID=113563 RepID=UPI0036361E3E
MARTRAAATTTRSAIGAVHHCRCRPDGRARAIAAAPPSRTAGRPRAGRVANRAAVTTARAAGRRQPVDGTAADQVAWKSGPAVSRVRAAATRAGVIAARTARPPRA